MHFAKLTLLGWQAMFFPIFGNRVAEIPKTWGDPKNRGGELPFNPLGSFAPNRDLCKLNPVGLGFGMPFAHGKAKAVSGSAFLRLVLGR